MARNPKVPPLVGKREAAEILGTHPNNLRRDVRDLPAPLQDRVEGMAVRATPLWTLFEILALAERRRQSDK